MISTRFGDFWPRKPTSTRHGPTVDIRDSNGQTPLVYACQFGHADVVRALLAAGADARFRDSWGMTPLHWAARRGVSNVVEQLIAEGIDVHATTVDGTTALSFAAMNRVAAAVGEGAMAVRCVHDYLSLT